MTERRMMTLETAERQLDRIQSFFPRIDAKVSALFAIAAGQIAIAAVNLSIDDWRRWWVAVPAAAFILIVGWALLNLYRCAFPHLEGGNQSLVYFNEIAKLRESEYIDRYTAVSQADLLNDITGQIWRNAEIVKCKYGYLKRATIAAMLSLIPWTCLLAATSLTHWKMPALSG